jgi:hypothetical protein
LGNLTFFASYAESAMIRVPRVYHPLGADEQYGPFIIMEALNIGGTLNQSDLGRKLALMHLATPKVSTI